eukprot:gene16014-675_t
MSLTPLRHSAPSVYDYLKTDLEEISPVPYLEPNATLGTSGGLPSVLVNRTMHQSELWANYTYDFITSCPDKGFCHDQGPMMQQQEVFQSITGQIDSPHEQGVSIPEGFRNGMVHHLSGNSGFPEVLERKYALGENSYFSESAYNMQGWQKRYVTF